MRNGWSEFAIGNLVERRKELVALSDEPKYRLFGIRWYGLGGYERGNFQTMPVKAKTMNRMREGDFVFNRIDTNKGAFTVVSSDMDGALATNEFPAYTCDESLVLKEFLLHHFEQNHVLSDLHGAGVEGRARFKEKDFESLRIQLPPLIEQQRIVDVMSGIDITIKTAQAEVEAGQDARRQLLSSLLTPGEADEWPEMVLSDHLVFNYGKALPAKTRSGSGFPVYGSNGVVGFHEEAMVNGPGIVVGRKGSAGAVTWAHDDFTPIDTTYWVSLTPETDMTMEFAFLVLQNAKLENYRAQTGVPGLNRDYAGSHRFLHPPKENQSQIVALVASADAMIEASRTSLVNLRNTRAQVLTALLSGKHEIPESYDDYLDSRDGEYAVR